MKHLENKTTGRVVEVHDDSKWVGHPNFIEVPNPKVGESNGLPLDSSATTVAQKSVPKPSRTSKRKASRPSKKSS